MYSTYITVQYLYYYTYVCTVLIFCTVYCIQSSLSSPLLQFGGKLVSFGGSGPKVVTISQVTTETELMERSSTLEGALHEGRFAEFCASKMDAVDSEQEKNVWNFLKVWYGSVCV